MKLNPSDLKKLFKECILELIQEGKIFQDSSGNVKTNSAQSNVSDTTALQVNDKLQNAVKLTTHFVSRGDKKASKLYESIIEDTAKHTLQKQLAGEFGQGGDIPATAEEKEFDKAQLNAFAAKDRWAQLAFGNISKK